MNVVNSNTVWMSLCTVDLLHCSHARKLNKQHSVSDVTKPMHSTGHTKAWDKMDNGLAEMTGTTGSTKSGLVYHLQ